MKIVIVDDEPRILNMLKLIISKYQCQETIDIIAFNDAEKSQEYLLSQSVDLVFLDIEMPELSGLDIAQRLLIEKDNIPEIAFVTAYPEYALKAWQVDAIGYVLKPFDPDQIYRIISKTLTIKHNNPQIKEKSVITEIKCFPDFNVFVDGKPIDFRHQKSKELLAFLVHHEGGWVSINKITFALLENAEEQSAKRYYRMISYRLKKTLENEGIADIIEVSYGKMRIIPEKVECDYYNYLSGAKQLYKGEYMSEYSWAEENNLGK